MWKNIINFENIYQVSNDGIVRNKKTGRILKQFTNNITKHLFVFLYKDSIRKIIKVHRLVLETFVGPCPPGMECRHLDGNPQNNKLENLKWGTRSENRRDRTVHGRDKSKGYHLHVGECNHNSKLTNEKVLEIDFLVSRGIPPKELAVWYGISRRTVWLIGIHKTWFHLWGKPSNPESK